MFRLRGLPLVALLTPLTLTAAPKGDGLTQKEIVDVIQSNSGDAVACFKEAPEEETAKGGKVKIRFLIGLQGRVEASQIEQNTFKTKAIGNCLRTKMKSWKFPKPRDGLKMNTSYPFVFQVAPPPPPPAPETPATAPGTPPSTPTAPGTPESPATAPAAPPTPPTPEAPQAPTTP